MGQDPLSGLRIVEFAGIGPGPFCGMLLADLSADVIGIDCKGGRWSVGIGGMPFAVTERGRRSIALNLKTPEACLRLIERADATFEGFRPGVTERLGPDVALARNPALVYGRMTGWEQTGPYAQAAGHDINYIVISGALDAIGLADRPAAPLSLFGDYGGGEMYLAFGLLAGVIHAHHCAGAGDRQRHQRRRRVADGGILRLPRQAHVAGRARGEHARRRRAFLQSLSLRRWQMDRAGADRAAVLWRRAGIDDSDFDAQMDRAAWPGLRAKLEAIIAAKTQAEWYALLDRSDACFAPVMGMGMGEAPIHPHNVARGTFVEVEGVGQPAPAPHFSAAPEAIQCPRPCPARTMTRR